MATSARPLLERFRAGREPSRAPLPGTADARFDGPEGPMQATARARRAVRRLLPDTDVEHDAP